MFFFALICLVLFAFYGVLIDYYRRAWKAIPYSSLQGLKTRFRTKISVLVPARNEEKNIGICLESLSRQSYPSNLYEVIVIDDHSTDRTAAIVEGFAEAGRIPMQREKMGNMGSVRCLRLADAAKENGSGAVKAYKKFAIETGIRAAAGELIITTDADCWFHPDWLGTIAGFYEETGAKFIAAPVRIGEESGGSRRGMTGQKRNSFLSIFQTLDFITLQGITGAAVYKKFHSMCNGANLAYEKKTFFEVEGFKDIDAIPSGDDMLLMHKIYKKYPEQVFFLKNRHAIVSTRPESSWESFVNQRIRWASKADKYDDKRIFWVLLLVYILNLLFLGLLLASWWNSWYLWLLLILIVIKTAVELPFVRSVAGFFGQQSLMAYFPVLQPFHILYTVVIGWLGKFGSYRWKERKINK
jgi:cellulose synthase/poly-beta-1,6-N-acetylglucosamine synthase-like glycosyltransferase